MKPLSKFATSVGIFTIVGPLIGNTAFTLWLTVLDLLESGFESVLSVLQEFVFILPYAYSFGVFPACTTGILFGTIIAKFNLGAIPSVIIGLVVGADTTALIFPLPLKGSFAGGDMVWAVSIGAISGAICGLITWRVVGRKAA
ncbi:MAG: hypothetical protein LBE22_04345 [Azoarcus sp.]|jgi:hypothetical protein|nr:hypothetical protein [Azoarcus sp.]